MDRLISAENLSHSMYHEAFEKDTDLQKWDGGCWIRYKLFENILEEQPTIEERKTGQWMFMFNGKFKGGAYWFECSECKRIVPDVRNGGWSYCPNCGAKMEGMII